MSGSTTTSFAAQPRTASGAEVLPTAGKEPAGVCWQPPAAPRRRWSRRWTRPSGRRQALRARPVSRSSHRPAAPPGPGGTAVPAGRAPKIPPACALPGDAHCGAGSYRPSKNQSPPRSGPWLPGPDMAAGRGMTVKQIRIERPKAGRGHPGRCLPTKCWQRRFGQGGCHGNQTDVPRYSLAERDRRRRWVRITTLDSLLPGKWYSHLGTGQLRWAAAVLTSEQPSILASHHPPVRPRSGDPAACRARRSRQASLNLTHRCPPSIREAFVM